MQLTRHVNIYVKQIQYTSDAEKPSFSNFSKYSLLDLLLLFDTKKTLLPLNYKYITYVQLCVLTCSFRYAIASCAPVTESLSPVHNTPAII